MKVKIKTLESEERRLIAEALNCYADAETDKDSARKVLELAKKVRRNDDYKRENACEAGGAEAGD